MTTDNNNELYRFEEHSNSLHFESKELQFNLHLVHRRLTDCR